MSDEEKLNPGHGEVRDVLRVVGPVVLGLGAILVVIGIGSFFSSIGSFEPPKYFWCAFLGMPMIFVGGVMTSYGYMGAMLRYQVGEAAPVGKDAFNYMADGTKGGVKTMASALGSGLREGMQGESVTCAKCGHENDANAKFCDECGAAMSVSCPTCGQVNDADAKFCDSCGKKLVA